MISASWINHEISSTILTPKSHPGYIRPIRPLHSLQLRLCSIRLSSHHRPHFQCFRHHLGQFPDCWETEILGINAQRQRVDERGGQDHHPPQAVIGVAEFEGTIAYGAGANLAGVANCLFAKISYGAASSRVGRCGLPDLLLEIPSVANYRCVKISYAAAAPHVGHFGLRGRLLEIPGEIPVQERCPLPTIVYGAGVYRVRAANLQLAMIFYGAGESRLAPCGLLDSGLKLQREFFAWEDSVAVTSAKGARNLSLLDSMG